MKKAYTVAVLILMFPLMMIEEVIRAFYTAWKGLHIIHDIKYGIRRYKQWWNANI